MEGWEACPEGPDEVTYSGCWKTGSAAPFPSMTPDGILMELLPSDPDSVAQFQETEECAFTQELSRGRKPVPFPGAQLCAWPWAAHSPCWLLAHALPPVTHTCPSTASHTLPVFLREFLPFRTDATSSPKPPVASSYVTLQKHWTPISSSGTIFPWDFLAAALSSGLSESSSSASFVFILFLQLVPLCLWFPGSGHSSLFS